MTAERHFGHPRKSRPHLFPLRVRVSLMLSAPLILVGVTCYLLMWSGR